MTIDELKISILNAKDIASFITYIYIFLEKYSLTELQSKNRLNSNEQQDIIKLDKLIDSLTIINKNEFEHWKSVWIDYFDKSVLQNNTYCFQTLLKIDIVVQEIYCNNKYQCLIGPLKEISGYYLYLKQNNMFFDQSFKKGKIRIGRQTTRHNQSSLNTVLNNFEIIKSSHLHDYCPIVKKYSFQKNIDEEKELLKIGTVPFAFKKWFEEIKDHQKKIFEIKYNRSVSYEYNQKIIGLIELAEKGKLDILVFPELTMNQDTLSTVKEHLLHRHYNHLKLLLLGSCWDNHMNKSAIISSQGSVLIEQTKKIPYKPYCKKEKCYYYEDIESGDNKIYLIDIDGIGRIAYFICADINDDSIKDICRLMNVNFIFVSAYTDNVDLMKKTANNNAEEKGIVTIIANSCAIYRDEGNFSMSYVVVPKVLTQRQCLNYKVVNLEQTGYCCDSCINTFVVPKNILT